MAKSQISLGQLPMADIDAYLQIVSGYTKIADKSVDTKAVSGVDADKIAIAALDEKGDLVNDRYTVDNALNLAGKPAANYLLKEDSESLLGDTYAVSTTVSSELKAVRDELYQMKAELCKAGLLKQSPVYNGFYDAFRNNEIQYNNKVITTISNIEKNGSSISSITVEDASDIEVKQFISFYTSTGMQTTQIIEKSGIQLKISPQIPGEITSNRNVYKTSGTYNKGTFTFGEKLTSIASDDVYKVVIKDGDERREIKSLNSEIKGFASKCCNMYSIDGFLSKIQVSLGCVGNPGNIKIVLYEIVDEANMELKEVGSTNSISNNEVTSSLNNVTFKFNEAIRIYRSSDYLVVLKAEGVNDDNRWRIGGYKDPCDDTCLCCSGDTYDFIGSTFVPTTNNDDIYIAFYLSEVNDNELSYYQRGVYTCNKEVPDGFTRLRVELKVNREGIFEVASNNTKVCNENNILELKTDNAYEGYSLFTKGQEIIVGNSIAKVGNTVNSNIRFSLEEDTYTPAGAEVYRNGYKVIATVKNKVLNLSLTEPLSFKDKKVVELPLVAIMPGKESNVENSSDRLIFEAEVGQNINENINILDMYDNFEIQIYWSNNANAIKNENLAGIIYDLSISTDKAYNKTK